MPRFFMCSKSSGSGSSNYGYYKEDRKASQVGLAHCRC